MMEKHMVMESKLYPMAQYMMVSGKRVSLRQADATILTARYMKVNGSMANLKVMGLSRGQMAENMMASGTSENPLESEEKFILME